METLAFTSPQYFNSKNNTFHTLNHVKFKVLHQIQQASDGNFVLAIFCNYSLCFIQSNINNCP